MAEALAAARSPKHSERESADGVLTSMGSGSPATRAEPPGRKKEAEGRLSAKGTSSGAEGGRARSLGGPSSWPAGLLCCAEPGRGRAGGCRSDVGRGWTRGLPAPVVVDTAVRAGRAVRRGLGRRARGPGRAGEEPPAGRHGRCEARGTGSGASLALAALCDLADARGGWRRKERALASEMAAGPSEQALAEGDCREENGGPLPSQKDLHPAAFGRPAAFPRVSRMKQRAAPSRHTPLRGDPTVL